jgi:hypothetical protein
MSESENPYRAPDDTKPYLATDHVMAREFRAASPSDFILAFAVVGSVGAITPLGLWHFVGNTPLSRSLILPTLACQLPAVAAAMVTSRASARFSRKAILGIAAITTLAAATTPLVTYWLFGYFRPVLTFTGANSAVIFVAGVLFAGWQRNAKEKASQQPGYSSAASQSSLDQRHQGPE